LACFTIRLANSDPRSDLDPLYIARSLRQLRVRLFNIRGLGALGAPRLSHTLSLPYYSINNLRVGQVSHVVAERFAKETDDKLEQGMTWAQRKDGQDIRSYQEASQPPWGACGGPPGSGTSMRYQ